jgi:hypothetical protein
VAHGLQSPPPGVGGQLIWRRPSKKRPRLGGQARIKLASTGKRAHCTSGSSASANHRSQSSRHSHSHQRASLSRGGPSYGAVLGPGRGHTREGRPCLEKRVPFVAGHCPFRGLADQRNSGDRLLRGGVRRNRPGRRLGESEGRPCRDHERPSSLDAVPKGTGIAGRRRRLSAGRPPKKRPRSKTGPRLTTTGGSGPRRSFPFKPVAIAPFARSATQSIIPLNSDFFGRRRTLPRLNALKARTLPRVFSMHDDRQSPAPSRRGSACGGG